MDSTSADIFELTDKLKKDRKLCLEVVEVAKDAASSLGLLLKDHEVPDAFSPVPVTLFPSLVSSHAIQDILQLQSEINLLMQRVAHDKSFLKSTLAGVVETDPFVRNLMNIYDQVDVDNQWELGLIRSDYLLHCDDPSKSFKDALVVGTYKQVEVNMICIAFAGLSSHMHAVHNRILNFLGQKIPDQPNAGDVLPLYGKAISLAYEVYAKNNPPTDRQQILLTVINKSERNTMDQRMVEFESGMICIRRTFEEISQWGKVENGRFMMEDKEVAVVYYRNGYAPFHYESDRDWETRLMIEKSNAIKCPSVAHQLSGFKKIQQELSKPEVLQRFITDESICSRMLDVCVGQWDVSSKEATGPIANAVSHPDKYVLKPNREGGGNNFYNEEMIAKLNEVVGTSAAQEFILMSRIEPPLQENFLVRPQLDPLVTLTISEVGTFGAIVAKNNEVLHNLSAKDVLIRSKASTVNEGGVSTGYACLSSASIVHV